VSVSTSRRRLPGVCAMGARPPQWQVVVVREDSGWWLCVRCRPGEGVASEAGPPRAQWQEDRRGGCVTHRVRAALLSITHVRCLGLAIAMNFGRGVVVLGMARDEGVRCVPGCGFPWPRCF
jgi:hypothetical protein